MHPNFSEKIEILAGIRNTLTLAIYSPTIIIHMNSTLPDFFKSVLWSYDIALISPERDLRIILVQSINYGSWKHWQWLLRFYGKEGVRRALEYIPQSEFRPQALKLASLLFGVSEMRYVSRSTYIRDQKALAAAK